jgi:uncharacterized protein (TIGR02453 family)
MGYDQTLAQRVRSALATHRQVDERKMFGGIAFMVESHMACGIVGDKLMLRVGPARYDELIAEPHVEPMDFTGRPLRGMIYVTASGIRTDAALRRWVELAVRVAEASPAKVPKSKAKASKSRTVAASEARIAKLRAAQERARPAPFSGVPKQTLAFLRGLDQHNDKAWFDAHRTEYQQHYVDLGVSLVDALGPRLQKVAPGIRFEGRVNGSLFRIHRDVRFSKDKTPYKAHLDLWFWEGDRKGWNAPGFFFRLAPTHLTLGCGMHRFEPEQLARYREAVLHAGTGRALARLVSRLRAKAYEVGKPERKTVPRGLPVDHERADLLRHDGLTVMHESKLPARLHSAAFIDHCVAHYRRFVPVHEWLLANLTP